MAERRMFAKSIIDSDAFIDMPTSARLLYYDLSMRADDDGFVNSPKKIMRMTGAADDDLRILALRKFIIPFETGIVVIKHWLIHNYIRKDTYKETNYIEEKSMLEVDKNKSYKLKIDNRQRFVDEPSTQVSIGKDSIGKDSINIDAQSNAIACKPSITITLNDKSEFPIYQSMIDEWNELYPNVDIMQELRNMKGWCNANPTKRKTKRGILRFINNWLSREQDKPKYNKQDKELPTWYAQTTDDNVHDVDDEELKRMQESLRKKVNG